MACLMGIDLGTSSVKAMIMDEQEMCKALASRDYDIQFPKAGYTEQRAELLWEKTDVYKRQGLYGCGRRLQCGGPWIYGCGRVRRAAGTDLSESAWRRVRCLIEI